jgi:hypothetical protein
MIDHFAPTRIPFVDANAPLQDIPDGAFANSRPTNRDGKFGLEGAP